MHRHAAAALGPLGTEAEAVLVALAVAGRDLSLKLNELSGRTRLPTGHVGRHLRTLERHHLARYGAGAWRVTGRGFRHAAEIAGDRVPLSQ